MSPIVWGAVGGVIVLLVVMKMKMAWRSPEQLAAARAALDRGAKLIDVRSPMEFGGHHAKGAINVPVGEILAGRHGQLGPKERPLVLYCRSGSRSAMAARTLRQAGFAQLHDLGPLANAAKITG